MDAKLPQPPPGITAPPAGKAARRSRRWFWGIFILGLVSVAGTLISFYFIGSRSYAHRNFALTHALSNARQIGMALFDFENDYGSFPDASTMAAAKAANPKGWVLGDTTSNELFRQLIVTNIVASEEIFFVKQPGAHRPDQVISPEPKALAEGECGFAYILGESNPASPPRPLLATPMLPGTLKFDPNPLKGRAVVLMTDDTAVSFQIRPDGRAIDDKGMDIFDPHQPYWKGKVPVVKWPDLPPYTPLVPSKSVHTAPIVLSLLAGIFLLAIFFIRRRGTRRRTIASQA